MKKLALLVTAFALVAGVSACGSIYTNDPGPYFAPHVVGMEWAHDAPSTDCGIGILADGSAFVAGSLGHPFLAAGVTWLGYFITGKSNPPGASIQECWNLEQWNLAAFNLYTTCFGEPALRSTWTSFSGAQAWVSIPTCRMCNQACQGWGNVMNPWYDSQANRCEDPLYWMDLVCFAYNHPVNGASMADSITTDPPPPGTTTDLPWPSDMVAPGWDVNVPVPPLTS